MPDLKFPLEFPNCPNCGGEGICKAVKEELFRAGRMIDPAAKPVISQEAAGILDPTVVRNQLTVTTLVCSYDVCSACGTKWAIRVDRAEVPNQLGDIVLPKGKGPGPGGRWPLP